MAKRKTKFDPKDPFPPYPRLNSGNRSEDFSTNYEFHQFLNDWNYDPELEDAFKEGADAMARFLEED